VIEIFTSVPDPIYYLHKRELWIRDLNRKQKEERGHFIPYLKDRVFMTLCAPVVIK